MSESRRGKEMIKQQFEKTVQLIRQEYRERIAQLNRKTAELESSNASLIHQLNKKEEELQEMETKNKQLRGQIQKEESLRLTLEKAHQRTMEQAQEKLKAREYQITRLQSQLREVGLQLKQLRSIETLSMDQSSISMSQEPSANFSLQISELFRHFPTQIQNFMNSIEGEVVCDPKQTGNMVVMFVSKDNLSLQKYLNVNRSFLKKKIKEHIKRFRYVLIHKLDE